MPPRCLLVGSGPASVAAAEAIRAESPSADILMVSAEPYGYYSRPGLAYYLAREEPERRLFPYSADDMSRLEIQQVVGRVVQVRPVEHLVVLDENRVLPYDRLLIATGAAAIPVRVPGAELNGVTKLDDLDDARDLIRRSRRARAAVIVGGGITALEIVEGLCARRVRVHYLLRKERYWGNVLSESESHIVEQGLRDRGVRIHYFTELAEILGRDGRVVGIRTNRAEEIPCDLVAVAIGVLPQKELAEAAGLECGRGVLVDEHLRSSEPDIFAAGDLAEVVEPRTGKRTIEVLWSSAVAKGRVAGHNMVAERPIVYGKSVPLNVTRLAGQRITIIGTVGSGGDSDLEGIARGDSETWRQLGGGAQVEWNGAGAHVRLALKEREVAGAIVMGDQALSFPLQDLIGARADVSGIVPRLAEPGAPVDALILEAWRDWRSHGV